MNFFFRQPDQLTISLILGTFLGLLWFRAGIPGVSGQTVSMIDLDQASSRAYRYQIDLASADWTEFALLPGIGKALAIRIIDFRQSHSGEVAVEELLEIKGIGQKKLAAIRSCFLPSRGATTGPTEAGPTRTGPTEAGRSVNLHSDSPADSFRVSSRGSFSQVSDATSGSKSSATETTASESSQRTTTQKNREPGT